MNQLSDRLNSLSPSATLAMSQKSSELKAMIVLQTDCFAPFAQLI